MAQRWKTDLTDTDVTPEIAFLNRRQVIGGLAGVGIASFAGKASAEELEPNNWDESTGYNNVYEFGTGKEEPAARAHLMTTKPWSVKIDGMVNNPGEYDLQDIMLR